MVKQLWRGAFRYHREAEILYAHAYTEKQAWLVMCRRLAKKHGVLPGTAMSLFDGSRPNYEITIEMEVR